MEDYQDLKLIKTILNEPLIANEFVNIYDETIFENKYHKFVKMIIAYIKAYKTCPTLRVIQEKCLNNDALIEYINEVFEDLNTVEYVASEFKYELDKLKNRFANEKLEQLRETLDASNDISETVKSVQSHLDEIKRVKSGAKQAFTQKTLKAFIPEFKQEYNNKFHNKELKRGILTGYSYIDHITNGFSPGELIMICGETGAGKSVLLNNLAIQMYMGTNTVFSRTFKPAANILYFSLEMPLNMCARRTLARMADCPVYNIRDAKLNKIQMESIKRVTDFVDIYPYNFDIVDMPRGVSVKTLEERFNNALDKYKPDVICVDYLGLLDNVSSQDDWLSLGNLAGQLHELARTYNIVVMSAAQLNRPNPPKSKNGAKTSNENNDENVGTHRVARSYGMLSHCNFVLQIQTRSDETSYSDLACHVLKNREGENGKFCLRKDFRNSSITDIPFEEERSEDNKFITYQDDSNDISKFLKENNWSGN